MLIWHLVFTLAAAMGAEPHLPLPAEAAELEVAHAAATTLSRYAAGHMPASANVLTALGDLQANGDLEHLTLLDSIVRDEHGTVREAAALAAEAVRDRVRDDRRRDFAAVVPEPLEVRAWLSAHPTRLRRTDGSPLGPVEAETVAYAALILEPARAPDRDQETSTVALLRLAEQREDEGDPAGAVGTYAAAAGRGEARAFGRIRSFGVDPERLILGLTAGTSTNVNPSLDRSAVRMLATEGSVTTVAVLVERATNGGERDRRLALEVLEAMLIEGDLPPGARNLARHELDAGTPTTWAAAGQATQEEDAP